ncbi:hypothetical protein RSOLAG1IB_09981 [Rhizoctonia solani AG-1 IB]|uniref:Uncharacterized protein n=1 Tax=Thanatephorus cucumeris (strain AG1-IB / isolate 7/3/14) TaxID=1108050 RepID=A0A0B7FYP8_THACB|nr:hypothetical protein RSOLAG1IB_09981 [Rhizoctonia solani AG-1 IB]
MNYPLPSTFISMGSTVPGIDEECDFPPSWELEHASSTLQHFSGSLTSENAFDPLDGFEPMSGLSNSSHLTESNRDGVALLLSTSHPQEATIIQENQLIASSDLPTSYGTNSWARAATTPHGLDEMALDVSGSLMTPAQTSLFQALLSLGEPILDANILTAPSFQPFSSPMSPYSPPANPLAISDSEDDYENGDPEHIEATVCGQLALDRNLESNSLPFTLHSYALWMRRAMFDPSRAAHRTRDYVIRHFAESEQSKSRTILIANIFRSIASNPAFDMSYLPKLSILRTGIQKALTAAVKRRANPSREIQIRESVRALEQTLEVTILNFSH